MRRIEEDAVGRAYGHQAIALGIPRPTCARCAMLVAIRGHRKGIGNPGFALRVKSGGRIREDGALYSFVEALPAEESVLRVGVIWSEEWLPPQSVIQSEMRGR